MVAIEPNWPALIWFCILAAVCCVSFLILSGMYPVGARSDDLKTISGTSLVFANAIGLIALVVLTGLFGYSELRTTSLIVFGGLMILFAPGAFEVWPARWRDSPFGLTALLIAQIAGICLLVLGPVRALS